MTTPQQPWWRGARGEWYVIVQVALIALVFLGPRSLPGVPPWPASTQRITSLVGAAQAVGGATLMLAAFLRLGRALTPLPYPKSGTRLVQSGAYALVRHPMYGGGLLIAYGWALFVHGSFTLLSATALLALLSIKASREERWLVDRFPEYREYQRRVPKLIPLLY